MHTGRWSTQTIPPTDGNENYRILPNERGGFPLSTVKISNDTGGRKQAHKANDYAICIFNLQIATQTTLQTSPPPKLINTFFCVFSFYYKIFAKYQKHGTLHAYRLKRSLTFSSSSSLAGRAVSQYRPAAPPSKKFCQQPERQLFFLPSEVLS